MQEITLPKLLVSREEAEKKIEKRLEIGRWLHDEIDSLEDSDKARRDFNNWSTYNLRFTDQVIREPPHRGVHTFLSRRSYSIRNGADY